ncbi:MAG: trigger factor [Pseudomonadota bacterium]
MEVVETSAEGLERKFTVKVPASELDAKLTAKLQSIKGNVQLKGFRKGKAPISFLKKMYGKGMMSEIVQEIVSETSAKAFSERDLQPAQPPHPQFHGDMEKVVAGEADLEYEVHAEILPTFDPMDVSELSLSRPTSAVDDAAIDEAIGRLAEQQKDYEGKGDDAVSEDGDMVVIDYVGSIDGEEFDGGRGDGHELVLGSDAFIPGFEEQLVGVKADTAKKVNVTFPEAYRAGNLAGKEAVFDVHVHEIKSPKDAEINDEFAKKFGVDDLAALKERLKERIEEEYKQASRGHLKRSLLDKLDDAHSFDLPKTMVDAEFNQIWAQVENAERDEEDKDKSDEELKAEYRTIAERRVRLGLVLAEIGKRAEVQVPQDELQRAVQDQAMREAQMLQFQGQEVTPQQVLQFYQQNPDAIAQIRAPLFEEKVVDYVFERASIEDKEVSKDELLADPSGDELS